MFHVIVLLLIQFSDQFVAPEIRHSRPDCSVWHRKGQHGIQRRGQDFDKKFVFEGYTAKRLTDKFPEKSWTKHGVNKLLKRLRDTGTVDRQPGSGRPRSARTEKTLRQLIV